MISSQAHPEHAQVLYAVHLSPGTSPQRLSQLLDAKYLGPIGELEGHHKFAIKKNENAFAGALHQGSSNEILWTHRLVENSDLSKREEVAPLKHLNTSQWAEDIEAVLARQQLMSTLNIGDPGFEQQWHLYNTVQIGEDMNVAGLWLEGITGREVQIAFIDDGLDWDSYDLRDNFASAGSYNFNERTNDPRPKLDRETHGTRCAGETAAGKNDICGIGIAHDAKIAGIRLLGGPIDESDEAAALNFKYQANDIYACSWGPPDDGTAMSQPGTLVQRALLNGVQNGRSKKGSIFVFAAGNGGFLGDNCNFDGYTNSIYTITIGAITRLGQHAEYSEPCAAQLAVAYSSAGYQSEGLDAIYTTDVGTQACTSAHGGTSAAGPLAAGAIALALSVRPELTWRDVQYLLYETAVPAIQYDNKEGEHWQPTSTGKKFSHLYGFGKIDTYALVQKAREWQLVRHQVRFQSPLLSVKEGIPQGPLGLAKTFEVDHRHVLDAKVARLEHVTVLINVNHTRRGDLSVELHSPTGLVSYLSTVRPRDDESSGYRNWTFMSVGHWGESGIGTWKLVVKDTQVNSFSGTLIDWQLTLWGEAIDRNQQPLLPPAPHVGGDSAHQMNVSIPLSTSPAYLAEFFPATAVLSMLLACTVMSLFLIAITVATRRSQPVRRRSLV